jgi:hypothetical protein
MAGMARYGQNPAARLVVGEGKVGEEHGETEGYLPVVLVRSRMARRWGCGGVGPRRRVGARLWRAPATEGLQGRAGEVRGKEGNMSGWSIGVEVGQRRGLQGELLAAAAMASSGEVRVRVQGVGRPFIGARGRGGKSGCGTMEGGAAGIRPRQGWGAPLGERGRCTVSPARLSVALRPAGIVRHVAHVHEQGRDSGRRRRSRCRGWGWRVATAAGLPDGELADWLVRTRRSPSCSAWRAGAGPACGMWRARWPVVAATADGGNRAGEGREERERKRAGLNSNFLKILHCNLKNLQHESCGKLKNLPVLFYAKVQLISSFGVNLNSLEVELFVIFLFKIQILVKVSISFS